MQALQKALAAQQGLAAPAASAMALDGSAPEGAIPEESGKALLELEALHEVRLKAAKDTNEELQLENGHLREECDRLRSENMKLQAVVTSIKQLILGEPAALSAHVLPTASTPAARADSTLVLMPVHEEDEGAACRLERRGGRRRDVKVCTQGEWATIRRYVRHRYVRRTEPLVVHREHSIHGECWCIGIKP